MHVAASWGQFACHKYFILNTLLLLFFFHTKHSTCSEEKWRQGLYGYMEEIKRMCERMYERKKKENILN